MHIFCLKESVFDLHFLSPMNYPEYLQEIQDRKAQGLSPKPIDGADLDRRDHRTNQRYLQSAPYRIS